MGVELVTKQIIQSKNKPLQQMLQLNGSMKTEMKQLLLEEMEIQVQILLTPQKRSSKPLYYSFFLNGEGNDVTTNF